MDKRSEEWKINKFFEDWNSKQPDIEFVEKPIESRPFVRICPKCNYKDSGLGKCQPKKCPNCKKQMVIYEVESYNPYTLKEI